MPRPARRPMLSLSVKEVTSVTATFVLSSKLDSSSDPTPASLGIDVEDASEDEESKREVVHAKPPSTSTPKNRQQSKYWNAGTNSSSSSSSGNNNNNNTGTNSNSNSNSNSKRIPGKFGSGSPPGQGIIAQTVYKLLFLTVNGIRWQRAVVKIDDRQDEAIIIIFGLVQGREYEIEFLIAVDEKTARERAREMERELGDGLERRVDKVVNFDQMGNVQEVEKAGELGIREEKKALEAPMGGEDEDTDDGEDEERGDGDDEPVTLRTQVVTKNEPSDQPLPEPQPPLPPLPPPPLLPSLSIPSPPPSPIQPQPISPTPSSSTGPPPPDRLTHLQQTLTSLTTERETLLASLKSLRRESQKADSGLRAEIEALKRASEKHVAHDLRARQKILALQESIKRAQLGAAESERQREEVRREVLEMDGRCAWREGEHKGASEDAERARREREEAVERGRRKVDGLKAEMGGLLGKLERLNAKREKMEGEGGSLREMERKLVELELDIEQLELKEKEKVLVWPPPLWTTTTTTGAGLRKTMTGSTTTVEPVGAGRPSKSATMM